VLYADPYFLPLGTAIEVRVTAFNDYGPSITSEVGSTLAIIQYVPDAPRLLTTNTLTTSASQIGISWSDGESNGQASVLDYSVFYRVKLTTTWIPLASAVANPSYLTATAGVTLEQGTWYDFTV